MGLMDWVYCDWKELPEDADPTSETDRKYTYGTDVFGGSGHGVIVENDSDPIKVFKVPAPIGRIMFAMVDYRFKAGQDDIKGKLRDLIGAARASS